MCLSSTLVYNDDCTVFGTSSCGCHGGVNVCVPAFVNSVAVGALNWALPAYLGRVMPLHENTVARTLDWHMVAGSGVKPYQNPSALVMKSWFKGMFYTHKGITSRCDASHHKHQPAATAAAAHTAIADAYSSHRLRTEPALCSAATGSCLSCRLRLQL